MSPEERQLLSDLFERVSGQANAPRDRDAEAFIADSVRAQPYAPYLLAQAVIVQEQALRAADQKLQELQAQVSQLQAQSQADRPSPAGGFLGGLFGGGAVAPRSAPQQATAPNPWGAAPQQPAYAPPPPQAAAAPWGQPAAPGGFAGAPPQQGGGFLKGALGAAAGVAGGVLLADSLRGLMGGGHSGGLFGGGLGGGLGGAGLGGSGLGGSGLGGGETVVNNFYDSKPSGADQASFDGSDPGDYQDVSDDDDDSGDGDDDYSTDA
jgi:hypothetical protein